MQSWNTNILLHPVDFCILFGSLIIQNKIYCLLLWLFGLQRFNHQLYNSSLKMSQNVIPFHCTCVQMPQTLICITIFGQSICDHSNRSNSFPFDNIELTLICIEFVTFVHGCQSVHSTSITVVIGLFLSSLFVMKKKMLRYSIHTISWKLCTANPTWNCQNFESKQFNW